MKILPRVAALAGWERRFQKALYKRKEENKVIIEGKFKNGRKFKLEMNRWIRTENFFFLLGFFAGEGTKRGWKRRMPFEIANSNPKIVRKIVEILKEMGIPKEKIKIRVQLKCVPSTDTEKRSKEAIEFWKEKLQLEDKNFLKPVIRMGEKEGSPTGTLSLRINSAFLSRIFIYWLEKMLSGTFPISQPPEAQGFAGNDRQPAVSRS